MKNAHHNASSGVHPDECGRQREPREPCVWTDRRDE